MKNKNKNKNKNLILNIILFSSLVLLTGNANAAPGIGTMFSNFSASSIALSKLVQYSSFIIGLFLVLNSIFKFSQLGSNPQLSPKTPIVMFFVGIGIFTLTNSVNMVLSTMALGAAPAADWVPPVNGSMPAEAKAAIEGVLLFIRLVGYISFIRGWLLINQYGNGKEGTLGRGLTHLAGGVAAINANITAKILANSFAPGSNLASIL